MDYEELEFELEILPDRIPGYDSYIYLGKFNSFLNYTTDRIELLFRMDVLEGIIFHLPLLEPEDIIAQLESLITPNIVIIGHGNKYKFEIGEPILLYCYTHHTNYIILSENNLGIRVYSKWSGDDYYK